MVYLNNLNDLKKLEKVLVAKRKHDAVCQSVEDMNVKLEEPELIGSPTKKLKS